MLRPILYIAGSVIFVLALCTWFVYHRDINAARARLTSGSRVIATACGPIQYADVGNGMPVLAIHGAGGGFDAGVQLGQGLIDRGFRVVAPSRFGYLRTPMPADGSPTAQADAHACLLDALKIDRVGVIGASAGSPSAMQFCLRHPEKCSALVLLSPQAYAPQTVTGPKQGPPRFLMPLLKTTLHSDFLFWLMLKMPNAVVLKTFLGTPTTTFAEASAREQAETLGLIKTVLPIEPRAAGMWNDSVTNGSVPRYTLEQIKAPTLLIAAEDDLYKAFRNAQYSSEHIPNARLLSYPTGGHILIGHPELFDEIARFLGPETTS
jgi:pimeloyl-ACP methyl ester carboxylesterase